MPTNPYPALLAGAVEAAGALVEAPGRPGWRWLWRQRGRVRVLHLHWLHVFYRDESSPWKSSLRAASFSAFLVAARLLGYRLVWTLHNAAPHDSPTPRADSLARFFAMNLSEVVIHCEAARPLLAGKKRLGGVHPIPHGSYVGVYPDVIHRTEARRRLGLDPEQPVFLAFGLIRGYKGIRTIVEAFRRFTAEHSRARLLVVGRPRTADDEAQVEELRATATGLDILWHLQFVPDDEVQVWFRAADYLVMGFERVLVSGSAILALSFGLPVIAPRRGCLPELVRGDAGLLYDGGPVELAGAMAAAVQNDRATLAAGASARADQLDWAAIGRAHVAVYRGGGRS